MFHFILFLHVLRTNNQFIGALATLAVKILGTTSLRSINVEMRDDPIITWVPKRSLIISHGIMMSKMFLKKGDPACATVVDKKTIWIDLLILPQGDVLYKKSYDGMLWRCVSTKEANEIMLEVHEGVCGPYMSSHMLACKIWKMITLGTYENVTYARYMTIIFINRRLCYTTWPPLAFFCLGQMQLAESIRKLRMPIALF